jgi:nucleotide-binding universal stress UspA family protein
MQNMAAEGVIAVGIDGSEGSHRALRWAVDEARRRRCAVEAVTAWPSRGTDGRLGEEQEMDARQRAGEAERHVVDAVLKEIDDPPQVSYELVHDDAVETLVRLSRRAQLLVVGSHGVSSLRHAALGSVSEACAMRAACPVVVIPNAPAAETRHDELAQS